MKETIEGNKLIAEFMGWEYNSTGFWEETIFDFHKELKFHSSWDWLMPVVEKIWMIIENRESLFYFNTEFDTEKEHTVYSSRYTGNNKEDCWLAVIEFIKWYNKQGKEVPMK